ncbi:MAG TPA: DUF5655 domain-containing protein [Lacipirellulaceae bacterium]|nr:DUF5655 domain-containing protein [Lacipirellulaceae bacterium]
MTTTRDWNHNREMWIRVLKKQTGKDVDYWNARIKKKKFADAQRLKEWLAEQDVTGYAEQLLVMEHFGYPDFLTSSADELIDGQYADRPHLRPIYEAVVAAAQSIGEIVIQARKGYVSLLTPKRTFARVRATTKDRIDLALRLEESKPRGRLKPSKIHETMPVQVSLKELKDLDEEVIKWLHKAYEEN